MNCRLFVVAAALAANATGACRSEDAEPESFDQDELQAILRDEALTQTPQLAAANPSARAADTRTPQGVVALSANPVGVWTFDDCTAERTQLADDTSNGNTAYRANGVTCSEGIEGTLGVKLARNEDLIYVPDQPGFTFQDGVTVAGWFNPTSSSGIRTLFRKRESGTSSFALVLNQGKFQFVVNLGHFAIGVTSPARARLNTFQHVAASYDGNVARLYVDGAEVAKTTLRGRIPTGQGPLLMGNDGSERRFNGVIDNTLFATHALTAAEVNLLPHRCRQFPPDVSVTPRLVAGAPAGSVTTIDIRIFNNNVDEACAPHVYEIETFSPSPGLVVDPEPFKRIKAVTIPTNTAGHIFVNVIPDADLAPGTPLFVNFAISEPTTKVFRSDAVTLFSSEPTECHVSTKKELFITDLSVVDDPLRAEFDPSSSDPRNGAWTFKNLVEQMAVTPADAPDMVEQMMSSFAVPQTINSFVAPPRTGINFLCLDRWPRTPDGKLDLARSPMRLNAIINRFDLRNLDKGDAGEGRFIFAINDPDFIGFPLRATFIFEYKLPARTPAEVQAWADAFHELGSLPFGEAYNAKLQAITDRFVVRGARPGFPNGNAINAVRTNDLDLSEDFVNFVWEMREFHLSPTTGRLELAPSDLTPDPSFNRTRVLAQYINANQASIIAEKHSVPVMLNNRPFQAGAVVNELDSWFAPGVDPEARHKFAVNTCSGCHATQETFTRFLHLFPRFVGTEATLSTFLTGGVTVADPFTGKPRTFNDLGRRNADLRSVVCPNAQPLSSFPSTLTKGIDRAH